MTRTPRDPVRASIYFLGLRFPKLSTSQLLHLANPNRWSSNCCRLVLALKMPLHLAYEGSHIA